MPLLLSPTGEGAEMAATLRADARAVAARLRMPADLERARLGGGVSLDLDGLTVGGAIRGDLGAAFGRPSELRAAGAGRLADWLGKATGLAVARSSGALAARVAAGQASGPERPVLIAAAEAQVSKGGHALAVRAARRGLAAGLVGGEARVALNRHVGLEIAGALERGAAPQRHAGVALEWRAALLPRDRLRAQLRYIRRKDALPERRVRVRYAAPLEIGRLSLGGDLEPHAAAYRAGAEWHLAF
jgi:hypothetical protein